ncbi:MAG: nucleotide-binding protein [Thermosphaera sp.]
MSLKAGGSCSTSRIIVLDASAVLAKMYRLLPRYELEVYTTPGVVSEILDSESRQALEESLELGLLRVRSPSKASIDLVVKEASRIGEVSKLSKTDVEIAALALELRNSSKTIVFTDDYSLQNLLLHLKIGFRPVKTRGITEERVYVEKCPVCGYVPGEPGEKTCPLCGGEIKRFRASSKER